MFARRVDASTENRRASKLQDGTNNGMASTGIGNGPETSNGRRTGNLCVPRGLWTNQANMKYRGKKNWNPLILKYNYKTSLSAVVRV